MKIESILKKDCIIENLEAGTKEEALNIMSNILLAKGYVKESFPKAILEREKYYPSALPMEGHKIAIPHTDAEHVKKSVMLFARLAEPLEFRSMGDPGKRIQVSLISMFAISEKIKIGKMLDLLITAFSSNELLESVLKAPTAGAIYDILCRGIGRGDRREL